MAREKHPISVLLVCQKGSRKVSNICPFGLSEWIRCSARAEQRQKGLEKNIQYLSFWSVRMAREKHPTSVLLVCQKGSRKVSNICPFGLSEMDTLFGSIRCSARAEQRKNNDRKCSRKTSNICCFLVCLNDQKGLEKNIQYLSV